MQVLLKSLKVQNVLIIWNILTLTRPEILHDISQISYFWLHYPFTIVCSGATYRDRITLFPDSGVTWSWTTVGKSCLLTMDLLLPLLWWCLTSWSCTRGVRLSCLLLLLLLLLLRCCSCSFPLRCALHITLIHQTIFIRTWCYEMNIKLFTL
jgi:hypothetical protein